MPCCTRSTSDCFPSNSPTSLTTPRTRQSLLDASLVPLLAQVRDQIDEKVTIIVHGDDPTGALGKTIDYESFVMSERPGFEWPELDERDAAIVCYTSGTTGNPKGVVYSHRSTWLHSLAATSANSIALSEGDRCLVIVPMFHVNAWGTVYSAYFAGDGAHHAPDVPSGAPIIKMIRELRPDVSLGVPTIWNDVLASRRNDARDGLVEPARDFGRRVRPCRATCSRRSATVTASIWCRGGA